MGKCGEETRQGIKTRVHSMPHCFCLARQKFIYQTFAFTSPCQLPSSPLKSQMTSVRCSVVSNSLQPHGLWHTRLPHPFHHLPELAQTHVHRVGDAIQPSHPLSSPSPPAFNLSQSSGSFQMSQFSTSGGQSIGALASASVLPINIQD